jgi:hypothetical protein
MFATGGFVVPGWVSGSRACMHIRRRRCLDLPRSIQVSRLDRAILDPSLKRGSGNTNGAAKPHVRKLTRRDELIDRGATEAQQAGSIGDSQQEWLVRDSAPSTSAAAQRLVAS